MRQYAERNAYADHLAEINKINPVIAIEDICNSMGVLIVPKHTHVTEEIAGKIARFQLMQPLELSVRLKNTLAPKELHQDILGSNEVFAREGIRVHPAIADELLRQCSQYEAYPLLTQKLTVMADRLPNLYQEMLPASTFAVMLGMQLGLSENSLNIVFLATQLHDSGFLNIEHELVSNFHQLGDDERHKVFHRQLLAGKQFIDNVPNVSRRVGRAILEHKERLDGSGWPLGLTGMDFCVENQVVALAVMLKEVLNNRLKPRGYGIRQLLPVLQMEGQGFGLDVYNAMMRVLRLMSTSNSMQATSGGFEQNHGYGLPDEFVPPIARYLSVLQRTLIHFFGLAKEYALLIRAVGSTNATNRPVKIVAGLEQLLQNSGLWDEGLRTWLAEVGKDGRAEDFKEIEVLALMYESIQQKLKSLMWTLKEAAVLVGGRWSERCEGLAALLNDLPKNYLDALQQYHCLE